MKVSRPLPPTRHSRSKLLRYSAVSVISTAVSQAALIVAYGGLGMRARPAAVAATLCGAVPSYWLNRRWAWRRRGRSSLGREVAPYLASTLAGLALSTWATGAVAAGLSSSHLGHGARTVVVSATYLLSFGVLWIAKFVLNEVIFDRQHRAPDGAPAETADRAPEPVAAGRG